MTPEEMDAARDMFVDYMPSDEELREWASELGVSWALGDHRVRPFRLPRYTALCAEWCERWRRCVGYRPLDDMGDGYGEKLYQAVVSAYASERAACVAEDAADEAAFERRCMREETL